MTEYYWLNGEKVKVRGDLARRLLDVIRIDHKLTATKEGCGEGECGACLVLLDDLVVNSCLIPQGNAIGKRLVTLEKFRESEDYSRIEEAYHKFGAVQCGFCTPGMVMITYSILKQGIPLEIDEIKKHLSGNLCRCTGYQSIFEAICSLGGVRDDG